MLSRRNLMLGGIALASSGATHDAALAMAVPSPGLLHFDVLRNDNRIGEHVVRLIGSGTTMRAEISVEIAVGFGPITVFRYTHAVREEWRDGQFQRMESRTNDDGTLHHVRAERVTEGVLVQRGGGEKIVLAADTIPLTHWNYRCTRAPLFNPQTGILLNLTVQPRAAEMIELGAGRMARARRYSLVGETTLDSWYDDKDAWTALRSAGRDGSTISYRRSA